MLSRLSVITPATQLPVTVELARSHLRIAQTTDDPLLSLYIATATEQTEAYLNRTLLTTSYTWVMSDTFPPQVDQLAATPLIIVPLAIAFNGIGTWHRTIEIPRGPVQAVSAISLGNWDAADLVLVEGTDFDLDLNTDPPRIRLDSSISISPYDHMTVSYTAGFGTDPTTIIPKSIIHAILLYLGAVYEGRGDSNPEIPTAYYSLLAPYRLKTFQAG